MCDIVSVLESLWWSGCGGVGVLEWVWWSEKGYCNVKIFQQFLLSTEPIDKQIIIRHDKMSKNNF